MSWSTILDAIQNLPEEEKARVTSHADEKKQTSWHLQRLRANTAKEESCRISAEQANESMEVDDDEWEYEDFMKLPSTEEEKECYVCFVRATSLEALSRNVCVVCAREHGVGEGNSICFFANAKTTDMWTRKTTCACSSS